MNEENNTTEEQLGNDSLNEDVANEEQQEEFEDREVDLEQLDDPAFKLEAVEAELASLKQDYLRALAEQDNMKKRNTKERSELLKYQGERVIVDLLEVLDNLELALSQDDTTLEDLKSGVEMIHKQFSGIFDKWEIKGHPGVGEAFDPQKHEALSTVPDAEVEPGTVIQELRKAYYYKDRLIRAGQVIVSKAVESATLDESEE